MSFITDRISQEGLTFDDVLLVPAYSEVLPREVSLKARFSRHISLNIPIVSAAMDTVTGSTMAASLALEGGIGVIHKNLTIEAQAGEVRRVKETAIPSEYEGRACTDVQGRLRAAAAVGVASTSMDRAAALLEAGADALVLDSAHGHSKGVVSLLKKIKDKYPHAEVIVGNIATAEAARYLCDAGADGVKVGIGPGSICTTRVVAGVGVPQLTAIYDCYKALEGSGIPLIADGGLRYSGDIVKALAAGGDCVMCGGMFAGTDETPGDIVNINGGRYKVYRGMGSIDAMQAGSADRYFQDNAAAGKLVPEGIVGRVSSKGPVSEVVFQILGGIRAGMGYCGAGDIDALKGARFVRITSAGMVENHPHDITITAKAPNYNK